MAFSERSRSRETKGWHCSENLMKLMKADRIPRVRSGSGKNMSLELKSGIRAAAAKRVLVQS